MLSRNFYLYCLAEETSLKAFEATAGIQGETSGLFVYDGVTAVVSRFDGNQVAINPQNLSIHQRVVQSILAKVTPLPFRFGTVISSVQLMRYIESNKRELLEALCLVRGTVEMGIRVRLTARFKRGESETTTSTNSLSIGNGPGSRFLIAKQRKHAEGGVRREHAEEIAELLSQGLGECVRSTSLQVGPTPGKMVSVAHLIEWSQLDEYRRRLEVLRQEHADLQFLTSGPWPPYSFCDLKG
jgi:hypothetical protein